MPKRGIFYGIDAGIDRAIKRVFFALCFALRCNHEICCRLKVASRDGGGRLMPLHLPLAGLRDRTLSFAKSNKLASILVVNSKATGDNAK